MKVLFKFNCKYDSRNRDSIDYTNDYGFELGKEYDVMGQCMFKESKEFMGENIYFLIKINNKIHWFPEILFTQNTENDKLPFNWYINVNKNDLFHWVMGYYELCNDKMHFLELLYKKDKALKIFEKRYTEYLEWEKRLRGKKEITFNDIFEKIKL